jgi:lipoprotein-releasing system permease protein
MGEGILLPKGYKDNGVLIGDRGYLSYNAPTASSIQEQRTPIFVAGFYDPGILPLGGKVVFANQHVSRMIRSAYPPDENPMSNGINIRFANLDDAGLVKAKLQSSLDEAGIGKYWRIETYREFEFTKDLLLQLRSERNLFSLISAVIIIVACSNIVSMLIILVNDKKMEIGILRSMGASSRSIGAIFGFCGIVMGLLGSLLGTIMALITLGNLQSLIDLISRLQGFKAFNPMFYGETLPNEISFEVLALVMGATALISLIAGIVPAFKTCLLRPSAILRSE